MRINYRKTAAALGLLTLIIFQGCFFGSSSISGKVVITAGGLQALTSAHTPANSEAASSDTVVLVDDGGLKSGKIEPEIVQDEIIVKYKPGVTAGLKSMSTGGSGYFVINSDNNTQKGEINLLRLSAPEKISLTVDVIKDRTLREIKRLNALPWVEYAEPNFIYSVQFNPNDEYYSRQWHLPLIKTDRVWNDASLAPVNDLSSVTVAVIDTGIARNGTDHPDLAGIFRGEYDFISDKDKAMDGDGPDSDATDTGQIYHGTHLTGIIGALTNNFTGIAGVAGGNNSGVRIMPLRAIGKGGRGTGFDIAQAILYAAGLSNSCTTPPARRADIINMSFGSASESLYIREAVTSAYSAGVTLVAAAGNEGTGTPFYPAAYAPVISVTAVGAGAERAFYSNFGGYIDISAPGGDMRFDLDFDGFDDGVYSTLSDGNNFFIYDYLQGTSMSASYVAGAAAMVIKGLRENPRISDVTPDLVRNILTGTATALGDRKFYGAGLINTHRAVSRALGQAEPRIPVLEPFPKTVRFEGSDASSGFTVKNTGKAGAIEIDGGCISVAHDPEGLISGIYPDSGSADEEGLWVQVDVNTEGFKDGSSHHALIEVTDNTGYTSPVSVVYKYVGEVYIVVWKLSSFPSSHPVALDSDGIAAIAVTDYKKGYSYTLKGLEPGKYVVGASTDRDGDGLLFEALEEIFGYFPDLRYANIMDLGPGEQMPDVDFQIFDDKL